MTHTFLDAWLIAILLACAFLVSLTDAVFGKPLKAILGMISAVCFAILLAAFISEQYL
jgi:predicted outer membrane lipoprotein